MKQREYRSGRKDADDCTPAGTAGSSGEGATARVRGIEPRVHESAAWMLLEKADAALQEPGVPEIVVVEDSDVRGRSSADQVRPVLAAPHGRAGDDVTDTGIPEIRLQLGASPIAAGTVLEHEQPPFENVCESTASTASTRNGKSPRVGMPTSTT